MAFIGLLIVNACIVGLALGIGIVPMLLGSFLYKQTSHKIIGLILRVIGFLVTLAVIAVIAVLVLAFVAGRSQ